MVVAALLCRGNGFSALHGVSGSMGRIGWDEFAAPAIGTTRVASEVFAARLRENVELFNKRES